MSLVGLVVAGVLAIAPAQETGAAPVPLASAEAAPLPLEGLGDQQVFARAADALQAIDTLRARFVQTAPSGNVTAGTIYLDRPGRLRFDYDAPSAQEIVATNGLVYVHDADLETTDSYPVRTTPLRYLLAEQVTTDGARLTRVTRAPGEVAVSLAAEDEDLAGEVALVFAVDGSDTLTLDRWAVIDPQGGITVVALDEVETGVRLSRRLFRAPEAGGFALDERR